MSLFPLILLGLLCYTECGRLNLKGSKETAGVWDEGADPEAYYEDEDFFAVKVPTALPPSAVMNGPVSKTFFLEKKVQLSQKGMEGWMEAHFADKSTVTQLAAHGPKEEPQQRQPHKSREQKRLLSPASGFRFQQSSTKAKGKSKVMPPVAGIGWNAAGLGGPPCPGGGAVSSIYYGQGPLQPNLYPDKPCYKFDFVTPYYAKPVHGLMPEMEVGIQSPPVNFYSDGGRYPRNMEVFDHYSTQGSDTSFYPNSPLPQPADQGAAPAGGAPKGKRRRR